MLLTVEWRNDKLFIIEQNRLPAELAYIELNTADEVADAISTMKVRGAPAIGAVAAAGLAIAALHSEAESPQDLLKDIESAASVIRATRPTAVNLFHGIGRMLSVARRSGDCAVDHVRAAMLAESKALLDEDIEVNRCMGAFGQTLLPDPVNVLTHCNAGGLATVGYGTALGVIRAAVEAGKQVHVYADETRPRLQGCKLTAWELMRDGIPVTMIADNMAAVLMRDGKIDCVITGADRIAANGDTANKIGTYSVAVLAKAHGISMYIAAPMSTVDLSLPNGSGIPIEERSADEMTCLGGNKIAPDGVRVINPSFDVTPAELIAAIITEKGVLRPPYDLSLTHAAEAGSARSEDNEDRVVSHKS